MYDSRIFSGRFTRRTRSCQHGFMFIDVLMAIIILGVLVLVLTVAMARQQRASKAMADKRQAIRVAEMTLAALHTGHQPPTAEGAGIKIHDATGGAPQAGRHWVEVETIVGTQHSFLTGLVPGAPSTPEGKDGGTPP
jgi:type II secretory pathway pseudopilin PulG